MKSMLRSFLAIALLACAAFASYCYTAVLAPVVSVVVTACTRLKAWTLGALALAATKTGMLRSPIVLLLQAKAYVLRLAKRERPELTASWRMCPST